LRNQVNGEFFEVVDTDSRIEKIGHCHLEGQRSKCSARNWISR
jgi:hypothetical protein